MEQRRERIGWVGTGVMGSSMCAHLVAAGHPVTLTTRTPGKADALLAAGAAWADSPAAVAATSDVVFVMVGYPSEVEDVVLAADGVLGALTPGSLVVDMTTSRPALAVEIATRAGLDVESVLASVSSGAAASWALSNLAPRIVAEDYAPGFFVDHFVKDMAIVLDEAARLQLALPGLALAHQLYVALQAQGHGRDGTQSLILALESLSPAR